MDRIPQITIGVLLLTVCFGVYYQFARLTNKVENLSSELLQIRNQKDEILNELNTSKRDLYLLKNDVADVEWPGTNTNLTPQLLGFSSTEMLMPKYFQITTQQIKYKEQSALYFSTNFPHATNSAELLNLTEYIYDQKPYFTLFFSQEYSNNHVAKLVPLQLLERDFVTTSLQGYRVYKHEDVLGNYVELRFFMTPRNGKTRLISFTKHLDGVMTAIDARKFLLKIINSIVPLD